MLEDAEPARAAGPPLLKRRYTNVEPKAASAECGGLRLQAPPPLPILGCPAEPAQAMEVSEAAAAASRGPSPGPSLPIAKRLRDAPCETPVSSPSAGQRAAQNCWRRQLTPRISWSSLMGDSHEDLLADADQTPQGRMSDAGTPRGPRRQLSMCQAPMSPPSPPAQRRRSGPGSPPERPAKARDRLLPVGLSGDSAVHPLFSDGHDGVDRFAREFEEVRVVGSGHFSVVYRARNRVDKQEYAIKKTKKPLARGADRRQEVLQEALALASVAIESPSPYIVRYFGSWIEDERLFIQTELCDGSLKDSLVNLRRVRPHDPRLGEHELSAVIRDCCMGLAVLHGKNLVHLDVKPENVLVKRVLASPNREHASASKIHKIADLGLAAAAIGSGCDEISEGDSRYLAREVLRGDFADLTKADVFSLGLMCYELATNPKELPCNGEEWHRLRDGHLERQFADHLPPALLALVSRMVCPSTTERPPCLEVLKDPAVRPDELSGEDSAVVEALQQQLRRVEQKVATAERKMATAEEKADRYWSELLHMKRQEMLREAPVAPADAVQPAAPCRASAQRCWRRSMTA
mmetsp:Transcript_56104/g.180052  ORF Transcript_56104/g.180052 Transcript_56104/m.180052 type:complete len:577 (+) Transcript_56104:3-1733(+)